jgi:hypothetical protein
MKKGTYKHYKGQLYQVLGLGLHTETQEAMVMYTACYETPELESTFGPKPVFLRPKKMFEEVIDWKGKKVPRFQLVKEKDSK